MMKWMEDEMEQDINIYRVSSVRHIAVKISGVAMKGGDRSCREG